MRFAPEEIQRLLEESSGGDAVAVQMPARGWLLAIFVLALVPYLFLPPQPLVGDAVRTVRDNAAVQSRPLSDLLVVDFWGVPLDEEHATGSYRPLVSLTYALQARWFGATDRGYHLFDMLLHAACAVVLALLIAHLVPATRWAAPLAALFAVHPLATEAVASVVGRADLMASLALLAALTAHVRAIDNPRFLGLEALAVLLLAAALFCKEYAAVYPFLLIAVDTALVASGRIPAGRRRRLLVTWALAVIWVAGYLAIRKVLTGSLVAGPELSASDHPLAAASFGSRLASQIALFLTTARLIVLPVGLNHLYGHGTLPVESSLLAPRAVGAIALLIGTAAGAYLALVRRREPAPAVSWLLYVVPLVPSFGFITLTGVFFAERHLYLALAAAALAGAWGLTLLPDRATLRRGVAGVLAVAIVAGVVMSTRRVALWCTDRPDEPLRLQVLRIQERLSQAALAWYPHSSKAWYEIGLARGNRGEHEAAAEAFEKALEANPKDVRVWRNLAIALRESGHFEESSAAWRRVLELAPQNLGPNLKGLGEAYLAAGRFEPAIRTLQRAEKLMPGNEDVVRSLVTAQIAMAQREFRTGNRAAAAHLAEMAVSRDALTPHDLFVAGQIIGQVRGLEEGRELFERALNLDPELLQRRPDLLAAQPNLLRDLHELAVAYDRQGRHDDAARTFRILVQAQPERASAWFNLGRSLLLAGSAREAVVALERGLGLRDDPRARTMLERARQAAGVAPPAPAGGDSGPEAGG